MCDLVFFSWSFPYWPEINEKRLGKEYGKEQKVAIGGGCFFIHSV